MLLLAFLLLQTEGVDWVDRNACPTYEDCGDAGVRCFYRSRDFEKTNPACAEELLQLACEAGSSQACLKADLRTAGTGRRILLYAEAIGRDIVHQPWRFWQSSLLLILAALFVIEWALLRQMGWRTHSVAFRDALVMNLVSAPAVLIALGEFDLLGWWSPALAWFVAILLEWAVLARLAPPPYHQPLGAAILANTLSGTLVLGSTLAWRKWAPADIALAQPFIELSRSLSREPGPFLIALAVWAVLLPVEALMLRLTHWASFGRSARDALLMNLAAVAPVAIFFLLGLGVFWHDRSDRHIIGLLVATLLLSILVKRAALKWLQPQPMSRPLAGAILANLASWGLAAFVRFVIMRK